MVGVISAFGFAIFNALNFLKLREIGSNVHSSVKTFHYGVISTFWMMIIMIWYEPKIYMFWKIGQRDYPITIDQLIGMIIVGFLSWMMQESLCLSLTVIKAGTVVCFFNISLVISFIVDTLLYRR